jgi:predicted ester cyclase
MSAWENKEIVRRLMEDVLGEGRLKLLPGLIATDYVGHLAIGDHYGPGGVRIEISAYRTAFPDLAVTLDDLLADGDKVIRRFTLQGTHHLPLLGIQPTGQLVVLHGIAIDRLTVGQLVESWVLVSGLSSLAVPAQVHGVSSRP